MCDKILYRKLMLLVPVLRKALFKEQHSFGIRLTTVHDFNLELLS